MTEPVETAMTPDEMRAYATAVADGTKSVKRSELVPFMRAFLAQPAQLAPGPTLSILGGTPTAIAVLGAPVVDIAPIHVTETGGVHIPRAVNHTYTPSGARELGNKILEAAARAATPQQ